MRFVDREERNACPLQCFDEATAAETFGCYVDQLELASAQRVNARMLFGGRDRTIDKGSRQGARSQCVDLVLHQGDEWRDHQRGAAQHHCGQLITERLAAAGGHNDDGIFSLEDRADHFGLARAETIEAEVRAQGIEGVFDRWHYAVKSKVSDL